MGDVVPARAHWHSANRTPQPGLVTLSSQSLTLPRLGVRGVSSASCDRFERHGCLLGISQAVARCRPARQRTVYSRVLPR